MSNLSRRQFLITGGVTTAGTLLGAKLGLRFLQPIIDVPNPLAAYPSRDWEQVYRDQYRYDSTFTFVCSPNDTHACRLRAFVRNGVMMRAEQNYDVARYADLYGNTATPHWHPRGCKKGQTFHRRVYGPYRLKGPLMRRGWQEWADAGFPYLDAANKSKFKFDARGQDEFLPVDWDTAYDYIARGMVAIAKQYSGAEGARLLAREGYPPEMIEAMGGAGTRTFKCRGGMGLLGVIGKYGMYRFSNTLALLDVHVRGVNPEEALGGRNWSNYTWHGDQAPGHPFVHGLQASDEDFNDLRNSLLHIQCGKNLVENKMPDSHWFVEAMERGAKIVTITPEYSPPATKSDYWIPIRPQTDTALFLGVTRLMIDNGWYDVDFVKRFTDFPMLVRADTLKRLRAADLFPDYQLQLTADSASFALQGLTPEQYEILGDYVVIDAATGQPTAITRDDVGDKMAEKGIDPRLDYRGALTLADGSQVEVLTLWSMYVDHLKDYGLDAVAEMTHAPKDLIERLAQDIATTKPTAIHIGEGINHWFHATLANRAQYLPLMLTGNIGLPGAGCYTWAGNYKAALFQGSPWSGPGFKGWVAEDPFQPSLDPNASGKDVHAHAFTQDEEPAYWNHSERPLIVDTPKYGRKVFTGTTHMPTPTKAMFFTNVNLINNAKHAYEMIKNVDPNVPLIISVDIEMTATIEYCDFALAANSWVEFQNYEVTASCSNPFLQIWKGSLPPLYDTRDDAVILAQLAAKLGEVTGDPRFADYWKFALENRAEVYIQRLLDSSTTTAGYRFEDIMAGQYGEPGAALMLFRTYPRIAFWEQVHDNVPFYTDTGRLNAYCDIPEAIEYGENLIVHREGPEATPYLPNVIVASTDFIRPDDYGIPLDAMGWEERTVRNVKMAWADAKQTKNPLWEGGYRFYCVTPKTRHRVHSSWSTVDWSNIWDSNFGDPYRVDKRLPHVGDHQLHIHPQAARDLGLEDGDYVYVDANPADRPYIGWKPDDPFYRVARLMLRVKYNPAYPYHIVMMKHAPFIATERSVKAHETRPDGLARSEGTGYQADLRYGSQQSVTRDWSMPMHQTDTLFHKAKVATAFIFGGEADNHAINTVPKETLVKISKAEDGGLGGQGVWEPATTGYSPGNESDFMRRYLSGDLVET
ncbi:MAG TPA: molybdopterin-dependent oxidoreductase [Anaerolineae bacterium]|nr:molybdopterin-dependent oxidoreductase [Anaerolineae bacterium]